MEMNSVIVTAYAKAPQNTVMYENNKFMGMVLEIHKDTHVVLDVEVTVLTEVVKKYFKRMIIGTKFDEDIQPLIRQIEQCYLAPSQHAMTVALKVAHQRYNDNYTKKNNIE